MKDELEGGEESTVQSEQHEIDPFRIFPRATPQQQSELRASIEAVGLSNPVIIDEQRQVIDGHERRDICEDLGIDWMVGADVRIGLTDEEKKALAIELNLWRRPIHLTREKRNELIDIYLIARPDISETQVADLFGVNQSTVNRRKQALMRTHKLQPVTATIGKDGVQRKVGNRGARLIVKNKKEYDSILPDIVEVGRDVQGLIRRPRRIAAKAQRIRALKDVKPVEQLPANVEIHHCDWRDLEIEPHTIDLVLTDVLWSREYRDEWSAVAERAAKWLKPDGLFASMIGSSALGDFYAAVMPHLHPVRPIAVIFKHGSRDFSTGGASEGWRPVPVFSSSPNAVASFNDVIPSSGREKDYHKYQQNVADFRELLNRLSEPNARIVDPFLGTGTTAVACAQLGGGRHIIGCDIDEQMVEIARHRIVDEGAQCDEAEISPEAGLQSNFDQKAFLVGLITFSLLCLAWVFLNIRWRFINRLEVRKVKHFVRMQRLHNIQDKSLTKKEQSTLVGIEFSQAYANSARKRAQTKRKY